MSALAALALALASQDAPAAAPLPPGEEAYWTVDHLAPPPGETLEVGGLAWLSDGRLAVSTRRGRVWLVEDALADDPADARFSLYCEGLWEGLGLAAVDGELLVLQRGELSRLVDEDGDGRCDRVDTVADGWGLSGNYHEFAFGLPRDDAGRLYLSLNVAFFEPAWWHGVSPVPWRGWVLRAWPDGRLEPVASGLRSPAGLGIDLEGRLLVTDNQGDWMPASPVFHVREGAFHGHPASLAWTPEYRDTGTVPSDTVPPARAAERAPAAVWLPYAWSRSPGDLVPDDTGGRFGPFGGQLFLAELTSGRVLRLGLEEVDGVTQGWVARFRDDVGSAFRVRFAPDGTLVVGLTNRGWGGRPPASGIARVRWTGALPMEVRDLRLVDGGFHVELTRPLAAGATPEARVVQYDYDYWWEYGSPERDVRAVPVASVAVGEDRTTLALAVPALEAGRVARLELAGVVAEDGTPLLHDELAYTVNRLPGGGDAPHVAKLVPPPPARESGWEGWLRLTWGDALALWEAEGWSLADVELDPDDPARLATREGDRALVAGPDATPLRSRPSFGDGRLHADVFLPEGGRAAVRLQGRYELVLEDGPAAGALPPGRAFAGAEPELEAWRGAGDWHGLDVVFEAPRFDDAGRKVRGARVVRALLDDVLLHEDVALASPNVSGVDAGDEVALGPVVLVADGPAAFGDVRFRPAAPEPTKEDAETWRPLLPEDADGAPDGWIAEGGAVWSVEDGVLVGEGPPGRLRTRRDDWRDVELRARAKVSDGGSAAVVLRAAAGGEGESGYAVRLNASYPHPERTGSVRGLAEVRTHLVPPDTWFTLRARCADGQEGTRVVVWVNGVEIVDALDAGGGATAGAIAVEQHHDGSVVELEGVEVRELE